MEQSLTLGGRPWVRAFSFVSGLGMTLFSVLTIRHYLLANFSESYQSSVCDISRYLNCSASASSSIAAVGGIPLGYFGVFVGLLVMLGALFPSVPFERTNKSLAVLNGIGVVALLLFSVFQVQSLDPLCSGYYLFSITSLLLFWKYGIDRDAPSLLGRYFHASPRYVAVFSVLLAIGAYAVHVLKTAESGRFTASVVEQYFSLPMVKTPSVVSPYWSVKSTERFEDAPIQVIEYGDFLCPDTEYFNTQIDKLRQEFKGKINIAFQFFPLDKACNDVVDKDKHHGACDLSYIAAYDPAKFQQINEEIFTHLKAAKSPEWRKQLAQRYNAEAALTDPAVKNRVMEIIRTGAEYEKTSDKYAHGIRSTPTMIINNRMVIGTFGYEQLRAIFKAIEERASGTQKQKFLEHWQE